MHGKEFLVDLDAADPSQVATVRAVNLGVSDGLQAFPASAQLKSANRLLLFTGTAICSQGAHDDDNLHRGVVRIRLNFPVAGSTSFKGSATIAALASVHGEGFQEDLTFAAENAITLTDPTDGSTVDNPKGLPAGELYVLIDAAVQGDGSVLNRIAYQANVLILDAAPDLVSILVRPSGTQVWGPTATFTQSGAAWDYQLNLSGPVPPDKAPFQVNVQSSDQLNVPLSLVVNVDALESSKDFLNNFMSANIPPETVTITATATKGSMRQQSATLVITAVK